MLSIEEQFCGLRWKHSRGFHTDKCFQWSPCLTKSLLQWFHGKPIRLVWRYQQKESGPNLVPSQCGWCGNMSYPADILTHWVYCTCAFCLAAYCKQTHTNEWWLNAALFRLRSLVCFSLFAHGLASVFSCSSVALSVSFILPPINTHPLCCFVTLSANFLFLSVWKAFQRCIGSHMQHLKFFPVICFLLQGQFVGSTGTESKKHRISNITWFYFKTGRKFCDLQAISYGKSGTTFSRKGQKKTTKKKHLSTQQKKYILYFRKERAQECPGASLDTCSLACICVEGRC